MAIGDQLGVALLAVLGSLLVRRFPVPPRLVSLVPTILSVLIVWTWLYDRFESIWVVLGNGMVSGLLASGVLFVLMGFAGKNR